MSLHSLGWNERLQGELDRRRQAAGPEPLSPARVVVEHRGAYDLLTEDGARNAELTGRLRHDALDKRDLPAVGDWVALDASGRIDALLPRHSVFVRKAAGARTEPQVIAANVDVVFIVTSANADFNPRRIERYTTAIKDSLARPVLVINKTDLGADVDALIASLGAAATDLAVVRVSALERRGLAQLVSHLGHCTTIALVGSSGVGKSTIANWLLDREAFETAAIRDHDARGRHTTTHRELIPLPGGGALIDTPGMREFSPWSDDADLTASFADVDALAQHCRFMDCQHQGQPGCAVEQALATGELDPARLEHYNQLQRELAHQRDRGSVAAKQAGKRTGRARTNDLRDMKRKPGGGNID
jgi:ribosome biogenesis GTPase